MPKIRTKVITRNAAVPDCELNNKQRYAYLTATAKANASAKGPIPALTP
jgi:hypothetical protein